MSFAADHARLRAEMAAPRHRRLPSAADGWFLTAVGLVLLAAAAAMSGGIWMTGRDGAPETLRILHLKGQPLAVPSSWLRDGRLADGATIERLDLVIPFAEERTVETEPPLQVTRSTGTILLMALTPADAAPEGAERPRLLYSRFLTGDVWTNPGGLVMRRFQDNSPYQGEDLYVAPPDGRTFAARCSRPEAPSASPAGLCLWEFRQGGIDAAISFEPGHLTRWEDIRDTARATLSAMQQRGQAAR
jgi:hypothetical protein